MMANGDLLERAWQWEIRGVLGGAATRYENGPEGWGGLGSPGTKTNDFALDQAPGTYQGPEYPAERVLTFPVVWGGEGPDDVMIDLVILSAAWRTSTVDVDLALWLPGLGRVRFTGRPRGIVEDLTNAPRGEARGLATFVAGDPTMTYLDESGS